MNLQHQAVEARAFRPEWGNEGVDGTMVLGQLSLRFEWANGSLEIPLQRLIAEVREGDEERVVFTDSAEAGLEIFTPEMELLDCPVPPLRQARAAWADRLSRRELRRRLRVLAWCAVVCVVATVLGSMALSLMIRVIVARIPPDWDATFGATVFDELQKEKQLVHDTNAIARIAELADPLLRALPPTTNGYRFHIVRDDDPNAAALPGGHIVIHTGLLEMADADELLGVLAHEVAHVTERHVYRSQISTAGPLMICSLFLGRRGIGGVMGGSAALLIGAGFSQEYETEADSVGWDYLVKANIDPRGMMRVFEKLKEYEDKQGGFNVPEAFHTHPGTAKRIRQLEARWKKLPRRDGFLELPPPPKLSSAKSGPSETPSANPSE